MRRLRNRAHVIAVLVLNANTFLFREKFLITSAIFQTAAFCEQFLVDLQAGQLRCCAIKAQIVGENKVRNPPSSCMIHTPYCSSDLNFQCLWPLFFLVCYRLNNTGVFALVKYTTFSQSGLCCGNHEDILLFIKWTGLALRPCVLYACPLGNTILMSRYRT